MTATPTLCSHWIDWAINMNGVINLKKQKLIFEKNLLHIVVPLDPAEGSQYTEPVHDYETDDDLDCIYKIITRDQYWINPIADEQISSDRTSSYTLYSNEELERW